MRPKASRSRAIYSPPACRLRSSGASRCKAASRVISQEGRVVAKRVAAPSSSQHLSTIERDLHSCPKTQELAVPYHGYSLHGRAPSPHYIHKTIMLLDSYFDCWPSPDVRRQTPCNPERSLGEESGRWTGDSVIKYIRT